MPAGRDLAWSHARGENDGRDRLHRLHGHRDFVEPAAANQEQSEARKDSERVEPRHGDRSDDVRNESAEIATRAAALGDEGP